MPSSAGRTLNQALPSQKLPDSARQRAVSQLQVPLGASSTLGQASPMSNLPPHEYPELSWMVLLGVRQSTSTWLLDRRFYNLVSCGLLFFLGPPNFSKSPDTFAMKKHPVECLQHKVCITASELLSQLQDWNNIRQFVSPSHFHADDVNDYFISQKKLNEVLGGPVEALLDEANDDTWPAIKKLLWHETETATAIFFSCNIVIFSFSQLVFYIFVSLRS